VKATILIAEADETVRKLIRTVLENARYDVLEAFDVESCLETARTEHVDVILLDCVSLDLGGMATLKRLRVGYRTADIPVLVMSGLGQYTYGFALWSSGWLVKPFRASQLLQSVERALNGWTFNQKATLPPALTAAV